MFHFRPYFGNEHFKRVEFRHKRSSDVDLLLCMDEVPEEELSGDMPDKIKMITTFASLKVSVLHRERPQMHVHTHKCCKKGRIMCRFGAPFIPNNNTRVTLHFPPTDDDHETK